MRYQALMGWLLTDDGDSVTPSGRTYSMAQGVTAMEASHNQKQEPDAAVKFVMTDIKIRTYKDVAVVTLTGRSINTENGVEHLGNVFHTVHVWEKQDGRWKLAVG